MFTNAAVLQGCLKKFPAATAVEIWNSLTGVTPVKRTASVEGRELVHGQDEQTTRNYLMLEGTDAKVHFIQYTPEMEEARSRGELRTNSFVRLRKVSVDRAQMPEVSDLCDAEKLLTDSQVVD